MSHVRHSHSPSFVESPYQSSPEEVRSGPCWGTVPRSSSVPGIRSFEQARVRGGSRFEVRSCWPHDHGPLGEPNLTDWERRNSSAMHGPQSNAKVGGSWSGRQVTGAHFKTGWKSCLMQLIPTAEAPEGSFNQSGKDPVRQERPLLAYLITNTQSEGKDVICYLTLTL